MLKLYKIKEKGFFNNNTYSKYEIEKEDEKTISSIPFENSEIYIVRNKNECSCKFRTKNKDLFSSTKKT